MRKKINFVGNTLLFISLITVFTFRPAYISTAQNTKKVHDSSVSLVKIREKEKISKALEKKGRQMFTMIISNYDTLQVLRVRSQERKSKTTTLKVKKNKEVTTYVVVPITIDSMYYKSFIAQYPNDTIPIKIEFDKISRKRNIFDKIFKIFKPKK